MSDGGPTCALYDYRVRVDEAAVLDWLESLIELLGPVES
jgi:hypothetical protein